MLKIDGIVKTTKELTCHVNYWVIPKGATGHIFEIGDEIVTINYDIADDEFIYVKKEFLEAVDQLPSIQEQIAEVRRSIFNEDFGFINLSSAISDGLEDCYIDDGYEPPFIPLNIQALFIYDALPKEVQMLPLKNYRPWLCEQTFTMVVRNIFTYNNIKAIKVALENAKIFIDRHEHLCVDLIDDMSNFPCKKTKKDG